MMAAAGPPGLPVPPPGSLSQFPRANLASPAAAFRVMFRPPAAAPAGPQPTSEIVPRGPAQPEAQCVADLNGPLAATLAA